MKKFNPELLWMLSPDHDDWDQLISDNINYRNLENSVEGVLLYPRKGISREKLSGEIVDWIGTQGTYAHGGLETTIVEHTTGSLGNCWAIVYQITSWYNHFDLQEESD